MSHDEQWRRSPVMDKTVAAILMVKIIAKMRTTAELKIFGCHDIPADCMERINDLIEMAREIVGQP